MKTSYVTFTDITENLLITNSSISSSYIPNFKNKKRHGDSMPILQQNILLNNPPIPYARFD